MSVWFEEMRGPILATEERFQNMYTSPESEIQAIFFADIIEKCSEISGKIFADIRPSISGNSKKEISRKIHDKSHEQQ